ncbi:alkylmercury lyase [Amycolatopsis jejuensis]|uniref:alkylmercury lyase n=1 Tax=Amycolatopsis jejuensis TaxID=330084 RepID=UPI000AAB4BD4|nr:alkylmercury lyase [Amycolatopsis jejuensis]
MCTAGPEVAGLRVELLTVPDCPNAAPARLLLRDCLAEAGLDAQVIERIGDYPSPTILVDGVDVMTPESRAEGARCRLDVPTRARVLAALASRRS